MIKINENISGHISDRGGITFDILLFPWRYEFKKERLICFADTFDDLVNITKRYGVYEEFIEEYKEMISEQTKCVIQEDGTLTLF